MIKTEWLRDEEVIAIRPEGEIDENDFRTVGKVVDPVITHKGRLEGLMVDARALLAHLRFVREHHSPTARIVDAGDQWWLSADTVWISNGVKLFASIMPGKVCVFENRQFQDAIAWAANPSEAA